MTFYVVCYRRGDSSWSFANQRAVKDSYESYPVMYQTLERAEEWAKMFRAARLSMTNRNHHSANRGSKT